MLPTTNYAGLHVTVDGFVRDSSVLMNRDLLCRVLNELIALVAMEPIGDFLVNEVALCPENLNNEHDEGGVSVIRMLSTSHVSIHTWPLRDRFSFDLFSCNAFVPKDVFDFLTDSLGVRLMTTHVIDRYWGIPE